MRWSARIDHLIHNTFRRQEAESLLDEELNGYIEEMTARKVRDGIPPAEARRQALVEAGGLEPIKEEVREVWLGSAVESAVRDLRYAGRTLRRAPGFAAVLLFTLALGIGSTITVFSVIHALLWRPLPYPSADRIVYLQVDARGVDDVGAAPGEVRDLQARTNTLEHVSFVGGAAANLDYNGEIEHLASASVSDDLLPLLGGGVALGRPLRADTDIAGMVRYILISDALWRRRFGADPAVIGREVRVNNLPMQIAGVVRADFRPYLPASALTPDQIDIWFPAATEATRDYRGFCVLARLKPGISAAQAKAELASLAGDFVHTNRAAYPDGQLRLSVRSLQIALTGRSLPALLLLAGAVGFVLLISCVNAAHLMLARGSARRRELSIRRAMGAGSGRLVRQMLTENLLLALAAGGVGLSIATFALTAISKLGGTHLPLQARIGMNGTVVLFALALTVATTLLFGLLPAVRLASGRESDPLRAGRSESAAPRARRLQRVLVIAEVALSIVPLACCGLMLHTFVNLVQAPLGFHPEGIATARIPMSFMRYATPDQRVAVLRDVQHRVSTMPGVEAVSAAGPLPFDPSQLTRRVGRTDQPGVPGIVATQQIVFDGYLKLVGTQLRQGRDFTADDIAQKRPVAIVDERLARRLWPEGALGRRLSYRAGSTVYDLEIVGITEPVRTTRVRDDQIPNFFAPYTVYPIDMSLTIRTKLSAASLAPAIQRAAIEASTGRAAFDVRPLSDYVAESIGDTRFLLWLLGAFAVTCVLLASVGLYGTLSYLIAQRTREFGIRMALGSRVSGIVAMVLREGLALTVWGAAIGLMGAWMAARTIRQLLYNVSPFDQATLFGVVGLLALVALAAAAAPAWRAARIDPNTSLRGD